jgi:hypothetical protein
VSLTGRFRALDEPFVAEIWTRLPVVTFAGRTLSMAGRFRRERHGQARTITHHKKLLGVITDSVISGYMAESDENSAQAMNAPKALRDSREAFRKVKAKEARFPKILQALGELAVESTQLEDELKIAVSELLNPTHSEVNLDVVNAIAQERRTFDKLADLVKELFKAYIVDEEKRKPFHAALREAKTLMTMRGQHIHASWSLDYTTDKVAYFAHKAGKGSVDPEDIDAIVKRIQACKDRIFETLYEAFRV